MNTTRQPWKPTIVRLINGRYPDALAAVASGSVVRGEAKDHSDIDVIVVGPFDDAPGHEAIMFEDWPVELYLHTPLSLVETTNRKAVEDRRVLLPHLFSTGEVLLDKDGTGGRLRQELADIITKGAPHPSSTELDVFRHRITNRINDLSDPRPLGERLFAASRLAHDIAALKLLNNGHWLSKGKAIHRALVEVDPDFADRLASAWASVGQGSGALIAIADESLDPLGGRLFGS